MASPSHGPVLLDRVVALLQPSLDHEGAVLVDATLGLGGHSEAVLTPLRLPIREVARALLVHPRPLRYDVVAAIAGLGAPAVGEPAPGEPGLREPR